MAKNEEIRAAQARVAKVFRNRPEKAFSTISAAASLHEGLRCTYKEGDREAVMDMPEIMGGEAKGPTPGFFARAGIAGCVSIGLKQFAIEEGVDIAAVRVEVEMDFDDGASLGLGDNSAAPLQSRLTVRLDSEEPEEKLRDLVARLLERDPWFLALREAQSVTTEVKVWAESSGG